MIWAIAILLAVGLVAPFYIESRRPGVGDTLRARAPGAFAALSDGQTHFRWHGPEHGPVLVCIHGLTTPSYVWDALVPGLSRLGFRILCYDLYGRGFSDRPSGAQTRAFFIRQLRELLQHQGIGNEVTLLGYSMGGSIATVYAAAEPARCKRLILLAPAGIIHTPGWLADVAQKLPVLGDWLMLTFGAAQLRRTARVQQGSPGVVADLAERQANELGRRGYIPAVLSSSRNMLAETLENEHRKIAARGVPVAVIWGQDDAVIPIRARERLSNWNPKAFQASIAGAGHGLGYTHPAEVTQAIARAVST